MMKKFSKHSKSLKCDNPFGKISPFGHSGARDITETEIVGLERLGISPIQKICKSCVKEIEKQLKKLKRNPNEMRPTSKGNLVDCDVSDVDNKNDIEKLFLFFVFYLSIFQSKNISMDFIFFW